MPNMNPDQIAAIVAAVLAAQNESAPEPANAVGETADERAARVAKPRTARKPITTKASPGAKASAARKPRANQAASDTTWTVRKSWKGQAPTSGLLWKGRTCGVSPKVLATADKYDLSCAIASKLGRALTVEA